MDLTDYEQRVLGCLIEKRRTTPDTYPLSLNALRTACNQATNRDPVMQLTDDDVRDAAKALREHGLVRIAAAGQGSRTAKYRHTAHEALPADDGELALLAVLLLRGPQTVGELRTRSERLHTFDSLDQVVETLDGLGRRGLTLVLEREPGRKEHRYAHQLGSSDPDVVAAAAQAAAAHRQELIAAGALPTDDAADDSPRVADQPPPAAPAALSGGPSITDLLDRLGALEARVADLEELID